MKELTLFETIFILAILRLQGNAYGLSIRDEVRAISRRNVPCGTLYSYLDQLFRKGYVTKAFGPPSGERGGRHKILYQVTPDGLASLKASYGLQKSLLRGIEKFVADRA